MAQIKVKFFKVTGLPSEPEANAFYFVEDDDVTEMYLTDSDGEIKAAGNSAMTLALMTWGNVSGKPSTFPPSAHSHNVAIGDTMTNATHHAIPFFGAAGIWAQNYNRFRFENTTNEERFFVSGRKADGAFRIEFDGWKDSAYTTGMYIKSTHASAYNPKHLVLENMTYDSRFYFQVSDRLLNFYNDHADSKFAFGGFYGNYIPLELKAGNSTQTSPRVKMSSFITTDVIAEFRAFAGQTGNIWEYRNSSNTIISALTASGAITLPQFASDASAPDNTLFWNTTDSRLQYKDPSGNVVNLA